MQNKQTPVWFPVPAIFVVRHFLNNAVLTVASNVACVFSHNFKCSCKPSDSIDSDEIFWKFRTINGNIHDVENNHQMTVALSANNIYVHITSDGLIQLKTFCFLLVVADELCN